MIQIDKEMCTSVGFVLKPHGLKGEVIAAYESNFEHVFESAEYFFIEIEGGLVPFYFNEEGVKFRNNESVIIKFDYIDSQEKAKDISGCKLYVFTKDLTEPEAVQDLDHLVGINVVDKKSGKLGAITRIDDFSGNVVITVAHPKAEILIPLSDEIIQKIDQKKKILYLDCPEGLIDIYLE